MTRSNEEALSSIEVMGPEKMTWKPEKDYPVSFFLPAGLNQCRKFRYRLTIKAIISPHKVTASTRDWSICSLVRGQYPNP